MLLGAAKRIRHVEREGRREEGPGNRDQAIGNRE
jgi:hypothetical protein